MAFLVPSFDIDFDEADLISDALAVPLNYLRNLRKRRSSTDVYNRLEGPLLQVQEFLEPKRRRHAIRHRGNEAAQREDRSLLHCNTDVRGFLPEDLNVRVVDKNLEISARREDKDELGGLTVRTLMRRLTLPDGADLDKIRCRTTDDGQLQVTLPLKEVQREPVVREVPITFVTTKPKAIEKEKPKEVEQQRGEETERIVPIQVEKAEKAIQVEKAGEDVSKDASKTEAAANSPEKSKGLSQAA